MDVFRLFVECMTILLVERGTLVLSQFLQVVAVRISNNMIVWNGHVVQFFLFIFIYL